MKTTIQSRKNGSVPRTPRQTKSLQSKRAAGTAKQENTVSVVFFNPDTHFESDDKSVHTVVEFPESVFRCIEQACRKLKIGWQEFFEQAMRAKLESSGVRAVKGGAK